MKTSEDRGDTALQVMHLDNLISLRQVLPDVRRGLLEDGDRIRLGNAPSSSRYLHLELAGAHPAYPAYTLNVSLSSLALSFSSKALLLLT